MAAEKTEMNGQHLAEILTKIIKRFTLLSNAVNSIITDETFITILALEKLQKRSPTTTLRKQNIKKISGNMKRFNQACENMVDTLTTLFTNEINIYFIKNIKALLNESLLEKKDTESFKQYNNRLKSLQVILIQFKYNYYEFLKFIKKNMVPLLDFYQSHPKKTMDQKKGTQIKDEIYLKTYDQLVVFEALLFQLFLFLDNIDNKINLTIASSAKHTKLEFNEIKKQPLMKVSQAFSQDDIGFLLKFYNQYNDEKIGNAHTSNIDKITPNDEELELLIHYTICININDITENDKRRFYELKKMLELKTTIEDILNNLTSPDDIVNIVKLKSLICYLNDQVGKEKNPTLNQFYTTTAMQLRETYGQVNQLLYLNDFDRTDKTFSCLSDLIPENINYKIESVDDLFILAFTADPLLLSQSRPSFIQWKSQNIYDENQTLDNLSKLLSDKDKILQAKDFTEIKKIINQNKPAWWKWWRNDEYHRYIDMEYNAKLLLVLQSFSNGQIDEITVIANINIIAKKHPHAQTGTAFSKISEHFTDNLQKNSEKYIAQPIGKMTCDPSLPFKHSVTNLYAQICNRLNKTSTNSNPSQIADIPMAGILANENEIDNANTSASLLRQWLKNAIQQEEIELQEACVFKK